MLLGRYGAIKPVEVDVRLNGHKLDEVSLPTWRDGNWRRPLVVNLRGYGGRDVEVEFEVIPEDDRSFVHWQAPTLLAKAPEAPPEATPADTNTDRAGQ